MTPLMGQAKDDEDDEDERENLGEERRHLLSSRDDVPADEEMKKGKVF